MEHHSPPIPNPYPFAIDPGSSDVISNYIVSSDSVDVYGESSSTRICPTIHEGNQALSSWRSTISFQSQMGLGGHGSGGLNRCNSVPGLLLVSGEELETKIAVQANVTTTTRPDPAAGCREDMRMPPPCRSMSFCDASTSSLHLSSSSNDRTQRSHDRLFGSLNRRRSTQKGLENQKNEGLVVVAGASGFTGRSDDDGLTPVEVQAMGAFTPMYNGRNYDRMEVDEGDTVPVNQDSTSAVGNPESVGQARSGDAWRTKARRMFSREKLDGGSQGKERAVLRKGATTRRRARHSTASPRLPGKGVNPPLSGLKKRPSLIFRVLNRTVKEQKHSHAGYERIPGAATVFYWADSILRRISIFTTLRTPCDIGHYHPEVVEELVRYFGSDTVRKQILLPVSQSGRGGGSSVFVHHPINLFILDAKHLKMERERAFQGRLLPNSRRSFLSLQNSRLSSESNIRIINRHGENWKLLGFSKAANPAMGDGQLSLADFLPQLPPIGCLCRPKASEASNSPHVLAGQCPIPTRRSSMKHSRNFGTQKNARRASASNIGWTESIKEFEGDLGSVHISGERMLVDEDLLMQTPTPPSRSSSLSWSLIERCEVVEMECNGENFLDDGVKESTPGDDAATIGTAVQDAGKGAAISVSPEKPVSGQWLEALQMMQEYEEEAQMKSRAPPNRARTWSKSSKGSSNPEGYVDQELREACRIAMMSAGFLENRRRCRSGSDFTVRGFA